MNGYKWEYPYRNQYKKSVNEHPVIFEGGGVVSGGELHPFKPDRCASVDMKLYYDEAENKS